MSWRDDNALEKKYHYLSPLLEASGGAATYALLGTQTRLGRALVDMAKNAPSKRERSFAAALLGGVGTGVEEYLAHYGGLEERDAAGREAVPLGSALGAALEFPLGKAVPGKKRSRSLSLEEKVTKK